MLYNYIIRILTLVFIISISGCYKNNVEPEVASDYGKKAKIAEAANLCQFNVELVPGYDKPTTDKHCPDVPVYIWSWRITKNSLETPDLNGINLFFSKEAMDYICAIYYQEGDNPWVYVDPDFVLDETLEKTYCNDFSKILGIRLKTILKDNELLRLRISFTKKFELSSNSVQALVRYEEGCCSGYIQGPGCGKYCYTEESAWAANFKVGEYAFEGSNWATYFIATPKYRIPIYADQDVLIGSATITITEDYNYEINIKTLPDWFILEYHVQVFYEPVFKGLKWIKNDNPIPGQFATKGIMNSPEFEFVDGCMRLVDPNYNWLNNLIITDQNGKDGKYLALHLKVVNRKCG